MKTSVLIALILAFCPPLFAASNTCKVRITYHLKSGRKKVEIFEPRVQSKLQCQKKAKAHRTKLAIKKLKRKEVAVFWNGAKV